MALTFNPFTGNFDYLGASAAVADGSVTNAKVAADAEIAVSKLADGAARQLLQTDAAGTDVEWTSNVDIPGTLDVTGLATFDGDIRLDDGIAGFTTTLQTITPTAARTISFPDATGTVALVGGSSGQVLWNNAGANAGALTLTYDGSILTSSGRFINSYNATASSPAKAFTGTWFTGGTSTTTKPQVVIEPTGTTSTGWSTSGTGLGVNAASGFAGRLLDLQLNGTSNFSVSSAGQALVPNGTLSNPSYGFSANPDCGFYIRSTNQVGTVVDGVLKHETNANELTFFDTPIAFAPSTSSPSDLIVRRDAADILAQRRTTNAQTSRVYGTYTDASNFVRAALSSTSTAVTLAAETAGTGADDIPLNLTAAGTGTVKVNSNLEIADAKNIVLATGTGTKIGTATTQKLGFWDKTPVVQPTTGISGATFVASSGGNIHPSSTFDGYTIAQVVAALRQLGILA